MSSPDHQRHHRRRRNSKRPSSSSKLKPKKSSRVIEVVTIGSDDKSHSCDDRRPRSVDAMTRFNNYVKEKLGVNLVAISKLGKGAFGVVYGGLLDGKSVAIKVELDSKSKSLSREANIYKELQQPLTGTQPAYPGLPSCLFYSSENGQRIMVLPMMGTNLDILRERMTNQVFSPYTTMIIAYQMLGHLKYIHSKGIIHKDIKPENMVVMADEGSGRSLISLLDFGMGKSFLNREGKSAANTHQKIIDGTPRFMGI